MGQGWVGRKESKWLGTSMTCKPPTPVVSPQSLEWGQRLVPAIMAIAANRDLLTGEVFHLSGSLPYREGAVSYC